MSAAAGCCEDSQQDAKKNERKNSKKSKKGPVWSASGKGRLSRDLVLFQAIRDRCGDLTTSMSMHMSVSVSIGVSANIYMSVSGGSGSSSSGGWNTGGTSIGTGSVTWVGALLRTARGRERRWIS